MPSRICPVRLDRPIDAQRHDGHGPETRKLSLAEPLIGEPTHFCSPHGAYRNTQHVNRCSRLAVEDRTAFDSPQHLQHRRNGCHLIIACPG
jgi:hypothetical protein